MAETNAKLSNYLLIGGAALGLGAAMWSALGVGDAIGKYSDAVAVVDGVPIPSAVYDTAIAGLGEAKINPLTDAEKREALERIIDEELLLRRALELGLAESDPPSRKAIVNAMLQFSVADAAKLEPTDDELRKFYADRPKLIAPQPLITVRAVSIDQTELDRAKKFAEAVQAGKDFKTATDLAGATPILLPNGPIIPSKIAEYAGPTIRDTALQLSIGRTAGPIPIGRRVVFVHVIDRAEVPPPPLEEVRAVVAEEWRKRKTEEAFEAYVKDLRSRARITYAPTAPKSDAKE